MIIHFVKDHAPLCGASGHVSDQTSDVNCVQCLRQELDDTNEEWSAEKANFAALTHELEGHKRSAELWQGIACRQSNKIVVALGNGEKVSQEIQAGYMQIITALARDWVKQAPRFMEATLEDSEGMMLLTVRKFETPTPLTLLKEAESEISHLRRRWHDLERIQDRQVTPTQLAMELAQVEGELMRALTKLENLEKKCAEYHCDLDCEQHAAIELALAECAPTEALQDDYIEKPPHELPGLVKGLRKRAEELQSNFDIAFRAIDEICGIVGCLDSRPMYIAVGAFNDLEKRGVKCTE